MSDISEDTLDREQGISAVLRGGFGGRDTNMRFGQAIAIDILGEWSPGWGVGHLA